MTFVPSCAPLPRVVKTDATAVTDATDTSGPDCVVWSDLRPARAAAAFKADLMDCLLCGIRHGEELGLTHREACEVVARTMADFDVWRGMAL